MVRITDLRILEDFRLKLSFSDNTSQVIDFKPFIGNDELTGKLADKDFFKRVKIYENGRGIYWPNEYDFCPDFLRYHIDQKQNAA